MPNDKKWHLYVQVGEMIVVLPLLPVRHLDVRRQGVHPIVPYAQAQPVAHRQEMWRPLQTVDAIVGVRWEGIVIRLQHRPVRVRLRQTGIRRAMSVAIVGEVVAVLQAIQQKTAHTALRAVLQETTAVAAALRVVLQAVIRQGVAALHVAPVWVEALVQLVADGRVDAGE